MRRQTSVDLGQGRLATVLELRVRDVRLILDRLSGVQDLTDRPLSQLVQERLPDLLALVGESLHLPAGEILDDLSVSECHQVGMAWWDLHKDFFGPLLDLAKSKQGGPIPASSTAPA